MSLVDEQWAFLQDVAKLIQWCAEKGYTVTGGELWRTEHQQREYMRVGLSKTMSSKHLSRLAIDLNLLIGGRLAKPEDYRLLGEFWESLDGNNKWGGNFNGFVDAPHFERRV